MRRMMQVASSWSDGRPDGVDMSMGIPVHRSILGSALVALVAPLAFAGIAHAAPVSAGDVESLPWHSQISPSPRQLVGASDGYLVYVTPTTSAAEGYSHLTVARAADGSIAWDAFTADPDSRALSLVGGYLTEKIGDSTYWPTSVRFYDVETHQLAGEIAVPTGDTLVAVGPGWLLTTHPNASPATAVYAVLRRLDGSSSTMTNATVLSSIPSYAGTDGTSAWFYDQVGAFYQVDLASGTATVVPKPVGLSTWDTVVVGQKAYYDIRDDGSSSPTDNGSTYTITAIDRTTADATTTTLSPGLAGGYPPVFMARGDGLAIYHQQVSGDDGTLWNVDLAGGQLGAVVDQHLSDARVMGVGKVATVTSTQLPAYVSTDDGSGPTRVVDLPLSNLGASGVALDGTMRVTWDPTEGSTIDPNAANPSWADTTLDPHERITTSGGVTLVNDLNSNYDSTTSWHLFWSGGSRDVTATNAVLGHGGELISVATDSGTSVQRVHSGEVVASFGQIGAGVDGSWVWTQSGGALHGVDVDHPDTAAVTVPIASPNPTQTSVVDVRGRWVLLRSIDGYEVVDTLGVVPPYALAGLNPSFAPSAPQLGNGFVVWGRWVYTAGNGSPSGTAVTVADLSLSHNTRDLVDPDSGKAPTSYTVDEAGSPALAFVGADYQPKVLHLPWLTTAPSVRDAAPTLTGTQLPPTVVGPRGGTQHFGWTFAAGSNANFITSYIVRSEVRQYPASFGSWSTTSSPSQAALDATPAPNQQICAQAMAVDAEANSSAWSRLACTRVDAAAPKLGSTSGSARFAIQDARGGVTFSYRATDDTAVASYDVEGRYAAPGHGFGSWTLLNSATTATSIHRTASPGSEWCFRFRARDVWGNVSTWSGMRCNSLALDDSRFSRSSHTARVRSAVAIAGAYTQLETLDSWAKTPWFPKGRVLAVWLIVKPRGGAVDVYWGGRYVQTISTASKTTHRILLILNTTGSGAVRFVQLGSGPVGVDAVTVER